jgi:prepilin-type processing-associated H-X9-DG protein
MKTKKMVKKRKNFSLLELLVVIAVLMLLVGMLVPVLMHAKESGRRTVCINNTKQLLLANQLYTGDNEDYYAPGRYPDNATHWCGRKGDTTWGTTDPQWDFSKGTLAKYYKGDKIRECPSFMEFVKESYDSGSGGYGYHMANSFGGTGWTVATYVLTKTTELVGNPSDLMMFSDAAITDDYTPNGNLREYPEAVSPPGLTGYASIPSTHFRHNGKAVCGFADGHAEAKEAETYSNGANDFEKKELGFLADKNYLYIAR